MSEAAFNEAAEAAAIEETEIEGVEPEVEGAEEDQSEAKAVDWQKKAHDKEGQAARERSRRRAVERELRETRERLERLEVGSKTTEADALEQLAAQLRDDDEDPITDINGMKAIIRKFLADQKSHREQEANQSAIQRQARVLQSEMSRYESDFAEDHPDYMNAAKHYRDERQSELEELGYSGQALTAKLAEDLFGVVRAAISAGKDPAETVYGLAKKRGFAGGSANDKLAKIGAAAASGVRAGATRGGGGALTWGAVASMKGAERDAAFAKLREQERKAG